MITLTGFFDGSTCIPLEKADIKQNQKVIITVLDEFVQDKDKNQKLSYFGALRSSISCLSEDFDETPDDFLDYT